MGSVTTLKSVLTEEGEDVLLKLLLLDALVKLLAIIVPLHHSILPNPTTYRNYSTVWLDPARQRLRFVLLAVILLKKLTSQHRTHTQSSVSRTDPCSHHHLTGSWWLQKENSEQQPSTFQRHRLSESPFNNSCITAQCRFPIKYFLPIAHYFPL